jgi:hypothetical protein
LYRVAPWTCVIPFYRVEATVRSVGSILVGFLFIAVLSFGSDIMLRVTFPDDFGIPETIVSVRVLALSLAGAAVYATVGCYLTARLAPSRPMGHALLLGALVLVFTGMNTSMLWMLAVKWYKLTSLALVMPCAWLGGWLAERSRTDGGAKSGGPASATIGA